MISIQKPQNIKVLLSDKEGSHPSENSIHEWSRYGITFHSDYVPSSVKIQVGKQAFSPVGKIFIIEEAESGYLVQFLFRSEFLNEAILIAWLKQQNLENLRQTLNHLKIGEFMPGNLFQELVQTLGRGGFEEENWFHFVNCFKDLFHRKDFNLTSKNSKQDISFAGQRSFKNVEGFGGQIIGSVEENSDKNLQELEILINMFKFVEDKDSWRQFGIYSRREGDLPRQFVMIGHGPEMSNLRSKIPHAVEGFGSVLITGQRGSGKSLLGKVLLEEFKDKETRVDTLFCMKGDNSLLLERAKEECLQSFKNEKGLILIVEKANFLEDQEINQILEASESGPNVKLVFIGDDLKKYQGRFDHLLFAPDISNRKEDIPFLVKYFLNSFSINSLLPNFEIDKEFYSYLENRHWNGGVREIKEFVFSLIKENSNRVYLKYENWHQRYNTLKAA